jgi:hypothetical protein
MAWHSFPRHWQVPYLQYFRIWTAACNLFGMESKVTLSDRWSDRVNRNLAESQIEGGVDLRDVPPETVLHVRTRNHSYTIVNKGSGWALICGHPQYCPEPTLVHIAGSTWGGAMLKESFIGRGMRLEFRGEAARPILTSPILDIEECVA